MIEHLLDEEHSLLHIQPAKTLSGEDFDELASIVDPYIERTGQLHGLVIEVADFPGWENPSSMLRHLRFVHEHHKKINRVAIVTDSPLGEFGEHVANHFVDATIRHFSAKEVSAAREWAAKE